MSRFSGPQHRGAMRLYRQSARVVAESRQVVERERDLARTVESARLLWEWHRSPEGRAARRWWRGVERRLGGVLGVAS